MLINKAISIAAKAHDGQLDKAGKPYIFHPLRVMLYAEGDEKVKCAAVLHDVLEDSDMTEADLDKILDVDKAAWEEELAGVDELYAKFGDKLPAELEAELNAVKDALND